MTYYGVRSYSNEVLDPSNGVLDPRPGSRLAVCISSCDCVSRDGVASQLSGHNVDIVADGHLDGHDGVIPIVVVDHVDDAATEAIRAAHRRGGHGVVVVATEVDDAGLLAALEAGAVGVIRRAQATPSGLLLAINAAAAGEGSLPPDLLGRLIGQVGRLRRQVLTPRGLTFTGLTEREASVLRLLAEGYDTVEVGQRLYMSERTVKNVLHDLTSRLNLRNRTHAVAYAIREGLI